MMIKKSFDKKLFEKYFWMFSLICIVFVFILNNHNETKTADENPLSSSNKTEGLYCRKNDCK